MGGRRDTIIEAPATLAQDWRRRTFIVEIGMDNPTQPPQVTMRQFTVRSSSAPRCTTTNNVLTDNNFYGLVIQNGSSESINDTISGGEYGIAVVADEIDTRSTIQNAKISGYDSVSREVREIPVSPCTVTVQRRV